MWYVLCELTGYLAAREVFGYRRQKLCWKPFPSLSSVLFAFIWLISAGVILHRWWLVDSHRDFVALVPVIVAFPIFNAIDIESRLVPTSLVKITSIYSFLSVYLAEGLLGVTKSLLCIATYMLPMMVVEGMRPGSIGGGDLKFGLLVGPLVGAIGSPIDVIDLLMIANMMAISVFCVNKVGRFSHKRSIPMIPYLTTSTVLLLMVKM